MQRLHAMSKSQAERSFHCSNDCVQTGCPGHVIKLTYNHTSDTVSVEQDGRNYTTFDRTQWRVLVNLDDEIRKR